MKELNCNEVVNAWGNFGDNNAIEYGTKFVKQDEEMKDCFHVVQVISRSWEQGEEGWLLSQGYVDLSDDWIDWDAIKEFAGFDNTCQDTEEGYKVSALIEYYGIIEFGGESLSNEFENCGVGTYNLVYNEQDVINLLKEFDIIVEGE